MGKDCVSGVDVAVNNQIRRRVIAMREGLDAQTVLACSRLVTEKLLSISKINYCKRALVYNAVRGEIDTSEIICALTGRGMTILYPVTANGEMIAAMPTSDKFVRGEFGVSVPDSYAKASPDLVIAPLVACDTAKNRLGFGKGYYDRFLFGRDCLKIGVCYDFQVVEAISVAPHDVPLDIIVTEKRIIL